MRGRDSSIYSPSLISNIVNERDLLKIVVPIHPNSSQNKRFRVRIPNLTYL